MANRTTGSTTGSCVVTISRGVAAARSRLTLAVTIELPAATLTRRKHAASSDSPGVGFNGMTTRRGAPGSERMTASPRSNACADDEAIAAAISIVAVARMSARNGAYMDTTARIRRFLALVCENGLKDPQSKLHAANR